MIDEFEINRRFKNLRSHLNLTVDELSMKTGIKSGQISSIENNRQKLYGWHIEAIAKVYPEYAYWLATDMVLPEAGQISPKLEDTRQKLQTGT